MFYCREDSPATFYRQYMKLWRGYKKSLCSFERFESQQADIIRGRFLVLKNRFQLKTLSLWNEKEPVLFITLFIPTERAWAGTPRFLGAAAFSTDISDDAITFFWEWFNSNFKGYETWGPVNGHPYLGFHYSDETIGAFQTAAFSAIARRFWRSRMILRHSQRYLTELDDKVISELNSELMPTSEYSVKRFSFWSARTEIGAMNRIVNEAFKDSFGFFPLTEEENWDIFRRALPLIRPESFLFLKQQDESVGFVFALPDYNQVFVPGRSDLWNVLRYVLRPRPKAGRILQLAILPRLQRKGLIKLVRHRAIVGMYARGMGKIENSYIDELNESSRANVLSTGGRLAGEYYLCKLA